MVARHGIDAPEHRRKKLVPATCKLSSRCFATFSLSVVNQPSVSLLVKRTLNGVSAIFFFSLRKCTKCNITTFDQSDEAEVFSCFGSISVGLHACTNLLYLNLHSSIPISSEFGARGFAGHCSPSIHAVEGFLSCSRSNSGREYLRQGNAAKLADG